MRGHLHVQGMTRGRPIQGTITPYSSCFLVRIDVETEIRVLRGEEAARLLRKSLVVRVSFINVHFGAFGRTSPADGGGTGIGSCGPADAASPTSITGEHLQPQLAQVHPLDLLLHSFYPVRTVVLCQALHVVSEGRVLVFRKNRVLVGLRAGEPVRRCTALVRIRVRRQNYRSLGVVDESGADALRASAVLWPDEVAA